MYVRMRVMIVGIVVAVASPAAALDCDRVRSLHAQGTRASAIARELGITTPEVQACLAGEVEEPAVTSNPARRPAMDAPELPAGDDPVPRPPNQ